MPEASTRRVLLDENVDRQLKPLFDADFEVLTVQEQPWDGLKNGELLRPAAAEFDSLVTMGTAAADRASFHQLTTFRE